jgi:CO/xanthine dehydrogenase Mo-binding subunit
MNAPFKNSRRQFLFQSTGLIIGFTVGSELVADNTAPDLPIDLKNNLNINSWLYVDPTGKIDVYSGKVEFGQGIATAFKQIVADEMDVNIERVNILPCVTGIAPNEGVTSGSQSVEYGGLALLYACAQARGTLLEKASKSLNVPVGDLSIKDGLITAKNGETASYWKLTSTELLQQKADGKYKPKGVNNFQYIGKPVQRIDIPAKVSGGVAYVQDMKFPGMLHARVVRPPAPRSKLISINEAAIKSMPGVVGIVKNGSFLAVVAKREEQAINALNEAKKQSKWEMPNDLPNNQAEWLKTMIESPNLDTEHGVKKDPTKQGKKTIGGDFTKPFIAHASIGPSCAIGILKDGVTTIYNHAQGMYPLQRDIVKALQVPSEKVVCIHREGSGMYGQSGADDVALDAALIAREFPNQHIRVQWMREDEFKWEPYNSAMTVKIRASLDESGTITNWTQDIYSNTHSTRPGEKEGNNLISSWYMANPQKGSPVTNIPLPAGGSHRNGIPLYSFPNQQINNHLVQEMPIRVSAFRTLGAFANIFAIESMMDKLAKEANTDPIEFRLRHLQNQRGKDVILKVAEMSKWKPNPKRVKKDGKLYGRGMAFSQYKNLQVYCAVVTDIEIDGNGKVRVTDIWAAAEAGLIINPDGFKNQIEGGLIQATSWSIYEEIKFNKTGMQTTSWADYPILRFEDVPNIQVELINRPNEKSIGVGEGNAPVVGAIANAIAMATNGRIYDLPFTPNKVRKLFT